MKTLLARKRQHTQVNGRILVPGKANVSDLAGLASVLKRLESTAGREEAVGIVHPDDLVKLKKIHMVNLEPFE